MGLCCQYTKYISFKNDKRLRFYLSAGGRHMFPGPQARSWIPCCTVGSVSLLPQGPRSCCITATDPTLHEGPRSNTVSTFPKGESLFITQDRRYRELLLQRELLPPRSLTTSCAHSFEKAWNQISTGKTQSIKHAGRSRVVTEEHITK